MCGTRTVDVDIGFVAAVRIDHRQAMAEGGTAVDHYAMGLPAAVTTTTSRRVSITPNADHLPSVEALAYKQKERRV